MIRKGGLREHADPAQGPGHHRRKIGALAGPDLSGVLMNASFRRRARRPRNRFWCVGTRPGCVPRTSEPETLVGPISKALPSEHAGGTAPRWIGITRRSTWYWLTT